MNSITIKKIINFSSIVSLLLIMLRSMALTVAKVVVNVLCWRRGVKGGCKIQIHLFYKHIYVIRYSTITKNPMRSKAVVLSSSPWYSVFGWLRNPDTLKTETSPWVQQISFQYPHHNWDQYCSVHIMEPSSHQERVIKNPTQSSARNASVVHQSSFTGHLLQKSLLQKFPY